MGHDAQDVAIGILEPGGAEVALVGDIDVAFWVQAGDLVVLEGDALALQVADRAIDVVDLPGDGGGLVGAGVFRAVDVDRALAAAIADQVLALLGDLLQAEHVLVEPSGPAQVLYGQHHRRVAVRQVHRLSSDWPRPAVNPPARAGVSWPVGI